MNESHILAGPQQPAAKSIPCGSSSANGMLSSRNDMFVASILGYFHCICCEMDQLSHRRVRSGVREIDKSPLFFFCSSEWIIVCNFQMPFVFSPYPSNQVSVTVSNGLRAFQFRISNARFEMTGRCVYQANYLLN